MPKFKGALMWTVLLSAIQNVASTPEQRLLGEFRRFTLNDIVPSHDPVSGQVKCCPEGTSFDGHSCALGIPQCPEGTVRRDDYCLSLQDPMCHGESHWNGNTCVTNHEPFCPDPYVLNRAVCVSAQGPRCPTDFQPSGSVCVSDLTPSCLDDGYFNGQTCIHSESPQCPPGAVLSHSVCISEEDPYCAKLTTFDKTVHKCVSIAGLTCPPGTIRKGRRCISEEEPSCPEETVLNKTTGRCISSSPALCTDGSRPVNNFCTTSEDATCSDGSQLAVDRLSGNAFCCPPNMGWDSQMCFLEPDNGQCLEGTILENGRCKRPGTREPECSPGLSFEDHRCVHRVPVPCPPGFAPEGNVCVWREDPKCDAFLDLVDGECVATEHVE